MRVCIFIGSYDIERHEQLKRVLESQNVQVVECCEKITGIVSFISAYFKMLKKHKKLHYDLMIIPWRGIFTFPLAKIICKKPIIYMPTISIYNTLVEDRKRLKPNSLFARIIHFVEKITCNSSNLVITESDAQIDYFVEEYNLDRKKFKSVVHSANEEKFHSLPFKQNKENFKIIFFGGFIPGHGVNVMVEAARILSEYKNIKFLLVGKGITKKQVIDYVKVHKLENVELPGFIPHDKLIPLIEDSDVCLGFFGISNKVQDAIGNKTCEILACKKPLITMDSKGLREINLKNNENCILVPPGNPKKLADAILDLRSNSEKREKIAIAGNQLYKERLSCDVTGKRLVNFLLEIKSNTI